MEVDLETGLPEAIKLNVVEWSYVQELNYEQIPFKCRHCHGYGHFARNCKEKTEVQLENEKAKQWTQVQKPINKQVNNSKGRGGNVEKGKEKITQVFGKDYASSNPFVLLSSAEDKSIVLE